MANTLGVGAGDLNFGGMSMAQMPAWLGGDQVAALGPGAFPPNPNLGADAFTAWGKQNPMAAAAPGGINSQIPLSGYLGMGLGAVQTLGGLYNSWQANKLAKEQFKFTKEVTNANLNNSIKSYNTQLSDTARTRAAMEGRDAASAQAYVDANKLSR